MDSIGCLLLTIALFLTPFCYIINGWVLSQLWKWFVEPFGVPALSVPYAIGVSLIVGFLTHQRNTSRSTDDRDKGEKITSAVAEILTSFTLPLITLGIGWIVSQFLR
jgi:hypothetical protein